MTSDRGWLQTQPALQTLPELCLFLTLGSLLGLAELEPRQFERLMQEDGWAEWATFGAFVGAAVFAGRSAMRARVSSLDGLSALGLALFCVFVAGEEISWGQRLLGFTPARVFLEHNFQQESNFHNLLKDLLDTRWMVVAVCLCYGVVAPYLAHVTRFPRALAAPMSLLPWFAAVAWLEFSYPYELIGELAELALGLLCLSDACLRFERARGVSELPQRTWRVSLLQPLALLSVLIAAIAMVPLNDAILRSQSSELVVHTRAELTQLAQRIADGAIVREKLFDKREVHKRIYTAVQAGYLELAPDKFYLDAWNSPYWIAFQRLDDRRGRVQLYSFGPNRRRELVGPARDKRASGDDVQVAIEVMRPARAAR